MRRTSVGRRGYIVLLWAVLFCGVCLLGWQRSEHYSEDLALPPAAQAVLRQTRRIRYAAAPSDAMPSLAPSEANHTRALSKVAQADVARLHAALHRNPASTSGTSLAQQTTMKVKNTAASSITTDVVTEQTRCAGMALFHNASLDDLHTRHHRSGLLLWPVVDAFVLRDGNPCRFDRPCVEKLPVVTVVLMARVYRMPRFNLTNRDEKAKRRREYGDVMAAGVRVMCRFSVSGTESSALPLTFDGDRHTLIVNCPLSPADADAGVGQDGRLLSTLAVRFERDSSVGDGKQDLLAFDGVAACVDELIPIKVSCIKWQYEVTFFLLSHVRCNRKGCSELAAL